MKKDCPSGKNGKNAEDKGKSKKKFTGKCNYCHKVGHKEHECRTKKRELGEKEKDTAKKSTADASSDKVCRAGSVLPFSIIKIGGFEVQAAIDTCATQGGYVDEKTGESMQWLEGPSKDYKVLETLGEGARARWGVAE